MKSFIKIMGLSLIGLVLPSSLVSCNGGGGGHRQGWVDGKFNISISARKSLVEENMLKLYKSKYEAKHPEVNIIVDTWGSIETSEAYIMQNALNRGNITDILYTTDDYTAQPAEKNNFVDLRPYYEASEETNYNKYYSTMLDLTSLNGDFRPTTKYTGPEVIDFEGKAKKANDGKMYGVYFAPREYNQPALILNKSLFKEAGIEIPKADDKWDLSAFQNLLYNISEFVHRKVEVEKDSRYTAVRGCELNQLWEPIYTTMFKDLGGLPIFTYQDGSVKSNLTADNNKKAFGAIIGAFGKGQDIKSKYALDQDFTGEDFVANTMFMAAISYPAIRNYIEAVKEIDFLPLPTEYVGTGCGGYGIISDTVTGNSRPTSQTVNGETRNLVDMCWDFVKYIISEEGQEEAGKLGYIEPVIKSMCEDPNASWRKAFGEDIDAGAFCAGKQLLLNSYVFAPTNKRTQLREAINGNLIKHLFDPSTELNNLDSLIATTNSKIEGVLGN